MRLERAGVGRTGEPPGGHDGEMSHLVAICGTTWCPSPLLGQGAGQLLLCACL